jgi:hypothetical protein
VHAGASSAHQVSSARGELGVDREVALVDVFAADVVFFVMFLIVCFIGLWPHE